MEVFLLVCAASMLAVPWYVKRRGRRRQAKHLGLEVDRVELRRGESVTAAVRVLDSSEVTGEVQVGLVCIERYDHRQTTRTMRGNYTQRITKASEVLEDWRPLDAASGANLKFRIPPRGLCSYEGACISYAWRISAREQRPHRSDRYADAPVWVKP